MFDFDLFLFLYKRLSVPCYAYLDDSENRIIVDEKENRIIELIQEYKPEYHILRRGEALIFSKISIEQLKRKKMLLVSIHRDTVFQFKDSFQLSNYYEKRIGQTPMVFYSGNIDNTIHVAISLYLMIKLDLPGEIVFAFTFGEESSNVKKMPNYWMIGAEATLAYFQSQSTPLHLALVLDICYFDPESEILSVIRNNFANDYWNRIKSMAEKFSSKTEFIERYGSNETLFYSKKGINTLNVTAPSNSKSIHSLDAEISSNRVEHTINLLFYLFHNLKDWFF